MEPFGVIAQRKNFVSTEDVERALTKQRKMEQRGDPHKLLGIIMLEMGLLNSSQLLDILQEMEKDSPLASY